MANKIKAKLKVSPDGLLVGVLTINEGSGSLNYIDPQNGVPITDVDEMDSRTLDMMIRWAESFCRANNANLDRY